MRFFIPAALGIALLLIACKKSGTEGSSCNLPASKPPAALVSGWVSGFTNRTQIVDVYSGDILGTTWSSGKYFKFTANGKGAEFYYTAKGQYSTSATLAKGSVQFDEGSTATEGSFTFYACTAHFKGWGSPSVDRDATEDECARQLTGKYYYQMEGDWLRIHPGSPVTQYSSSFRKTD